MKPTAPFLPIPASSFSSILTISLAHITLLGSRHYPALLYDPVLLLPHYSDTLLFSSLCHLLVHITVSPQPHQHHCQYHFGSSPSITVIASFPLDNFGTTCLAAAITANGSNAGDRLGHLVLILKRFPQQFPPFLY